MIKLLFPLIMGLFPLMSNAAPDKGLQLMTTSDKANAGFLGEESQMEMTLINAHGDRIERKMLSKVKETTDDGDKSVITFTWPADVKGTKMLTWTHKKGSDDQWLYLPALKRVKRITSRNKTGSFMGSEFTYEDLGSQELEKYTYKFVQEKKTNSRDVWVIERVSEDKNSGYSKQVVHLDKFYQNPIFIEYFDRKGELLKTATFSDWVQHGKFWRSHKIDMRNKQTKKASILVWKNRKLNLKFPDIDFNKNKLKL